LNELVPSDPTFARVATWERRVAIHLDPSDPGIASFLPRVIAVVQGVLGTVLQNLGTRFAHEPMAGEHARMIMEIGEIVSLKAQ